MREMAQRAWARRCREGASEMVRGDTETPRELARQ